MDDDDDEQQQMEDVFTSTEEQFFDKCRTGAMSRSELSEVLVSHHMLLVANVVQRHCSTQLSSPTSRGWGGVDEDSNSTSSSGSSDTGVTGGDTSRGASSSVSADGGSSSGDSPSSTTPQPNEEQPPAKAEASVLADSSSMVLVESSERDGPLAVARALERLSLLPAMSLDQEDATAAEDPGPSAEEEKKQAVAGESAAVAEVADATAFDAVNRTILSSSSPPPA
eukprot:CAMPEP_0171776306 /NCGR_PEP_ID=MMETSP0991-20121206/57064_1 /TAXON_ID=483369 /ORGANISM="non described non described, Strain CCMP2098" /LENGTH=224 /DNA_ID=CAMNT_0012382717 /DNA_START=38 /DNA_END=710 /DNA_ORIENTATION=-